MTNLKICDKDLRKGKQRHGNRHTYMGGFNLSINGVGKHIHPNGIGTFGGEKKKRFNNNLTQIGKQKPHS